MNDLGKRRHARYDSLNLSYICVDRNNVIVNEGMGRTLNVSESGILLETYFPMETKHFLTVTVALEEDLVDVRGKVVHCSYGEDGKFHAGVEFFDVDPDVKAVLLKFIRFFESRYKPDSSKQEKGNSQS